MRIELNSTLGSVTRHLNRTSHIDFPRSGAGILICINGNSLDGGDDPQKMSAKIKEKFTIHRFCAIYLLDYEMIDAECRS